MFASLMLLKPKPAAAQLNPLCDGLVSYFKMDDNSYEEISSAFGTDTNVVYDVSYGKINQGGLFDGSTSQIVTSVSPNVLGATPRTSSVWIKSTKSGGVFTAMPIFGYGGAMPGQMWVPTIHHMEMGGPVVETFVLDLGGQIMTGPVIVVMGLWHHVVWTYDGVNTTCFLDGVSWTPAAASPDTASGPIVIGKSIIMMDKFTGCIDEIALWNRVLTFTEITQLYNAGAGKQYPF